MAEETPAVPAQTTPVAAAPPPAPVIPPEVVEKERALRADQQRLAKEREALAKERRELDEWRAQQAAKKVEEMDPLDKLKHTTERLSALEASQKAAEDARIKREWAATQAKEIEADPSRWELTLTHGYASAVPVRIEQHYQRTGEMITAAQAGDLIEKELEAAVEKSLKAKKFAARFGQQAAPAKPGDAPQEGRAAPSKTITSSMGGSQTSPPPKPQSREERMRMVIEKTAALQAAKK